MRGPSKNLQLIFKAVTDNKLPFSSLESQIPNILKNTTNLVDTFVDNSGRTYYYNSFTGVSAWTQEEAMELPKTSGRVSSGSV